MNARCTMVLFKPAFSILFNVALNCASSIAQDTISTPITFFTEAAQINPMVPVFNKSSTTLKNLRYRFRNKYPIQLHLCHRFPLNLALFCTSIPWFLCSPCWCRTSEIENRLTPNAHVLERRPAVKREISIQATLQTIQAFQPKAKCRHSRP